MTNRIFFNIEFKKIPENIVFDTNVIENKVARESLEQYYLKIKQSNDKKTFIDYVLYVLVKLKITKFIKKFFLKS